jgi:hypothetical protein
MTLRRGRLMAHLVPLLLCWSGMAQAEATPRERFTTAINEINAGLGTIKAVTAPPPFVHPAQRARYEIVRETIAVFGTEAFPVDGMATFDTICAPLNEATVKHMFVGTAGLKKPGMTDAQLALLLQAATQRNALAYQNETVRLTVANLHCLTAHLPFMARFAEGLKPEEFTSIRRAGLEKTGTGLINTVFGLATQPLVPGSTPENSRMAIDAALKYAPAAVGFSIPAARQQAVRKMNVLASKVPPAFRSDFLKIRAVLQDQSCSSVCARLLATAPPSGTPPAVPR